MDAHETMLRARNRQERNDQAALRREANAHAKAA
jgi:hypothetical protein